MIGFHEDRFPEDVSYGSAGGPVFKTQLFEAFRGGEKRNIDWAQPLMKFNVAYGVKTDVQMYRLIEFFNARQGRAYGFRYKNWANYRIVNRPFATGDGVNSRLPIWKFYGFQGARTYKRLRKIVRGSVTNVRVLGTPVVEGTDFNIDYDTGEIALNFAPGYGIPVYCDMLEFDEPVRFDFDAIQPVIDGFNNQSLSSIPLLGVKSGFSEGSIFAPALDNTGEDDFFDSVRLILNFDDTADLTTTFDQSELSVPVTLNSPATLTTQSFLHGNGSLELGTTGYVSMTGEPYSLRGLPFTLEVFAQQPTAGEENQIIAGKWDEGANNRCWILRYIRSTRQLQFAISTDGIDEQLVLNFPWTTAVEGKFDYISIDRQPNGWYVLRINGKPEQQSKTLTLANDAPTNLNIGGYPSPSAGQGSYRGLIDSVRFTIGRSRHAGFDNISIPGPYVVAP